MQIKIRAWDKVNKRMQSWEELLAGKEFNAKLRDPEAHGMVLMMWTGLTDKNGVEIYERDALKGRFMFTDVDGESSIHTSVGVVRWAENSGCWVVDGEVFRGEDLKDWNVGELCIIGNIYENPELIQKEGNPTTK